MMKIVRFYPASIWMIIVLSCMFTFSCGRRNTESTQENIIAKIGVKSISANEFIRRAEFTIRPKYCSMNNYIHQKIVLNSLIAEKLLALEAGESNELTQNEQFVDYIKGRQEQAMRQWQYYDIAYNKVELDTAEIKKTFLLAERKYKIAYCNLEDAGKIKFIDDEIRKENGSLEDVLKTRFSMEEIPLREVSWDEQDDEIIHEAFFSEPLRVNQIIGPLKTGDDRYLLMQIKGWTDQIAVTDNDIKERWDEVKNYMSRKNANIIYHDYVANVMKGKSVEFASGTFFQLAEILAPFYLKSEKEKKEAFNKRFWKDEVIEQDFGGNIETILDDPLLQIEDEIWTVREFEKEIRIHPLVFRKRKLNRSEFPEQLKFAIVDLIRDKYVTREAYKKGYDEVSEVQRNVVMWSDYLLSLYQKNRFLATIDGKDKDYLYVITHHLNAYVDSLQKKYHDVIEIDTDNFEGIQLSRIDMFVIQRNVPFPIIVPGFPLLTTDNKLDYGRKME